MGFIYKIYNDINDKIYIGLTSQSLASRWRQHKKVSSKGLTKLYVDIRKYGIDHFFISKIIEVPNEQLQEKEKEYIQKYNSCLNGYNSTLGGEGFHSLIEEEIDLLVELYDSGLSIQKIAKIVNHDTHTCSNALKSRGIEIIQNRLDSLPKGIHPIKIMELNLSFDSIREAAKYLHTQGIIASSIHAIECGIGLSAKEFRAYKGFNFRYED